MQQSFVKIGRVAQQVINPSFLATTGQYSLLLPSLFSHFPLQIQCMSILGDAVVTGSEDHGLRVYDLYKKPSMLANIDIEIQLNLSGHYSIKNMGIVNGLLLVSS